RCGAALPAGVQPRPQPDREDVQQAEGLLVKGRRAHGGPAVRGDGGRVAFGDTSGYRRVVPILWLLYTQAETALAVSDLGPGPTPGPPAGRERPCGSRAAAPRASASAPGADPGKGLRQTPPLAQGAGRARPDDRRDAEAAHTEAVGRHHDACEFPARSGVG